MRDKIIETYRSQFKSEPAACFFSPGRINIIGEHTDYNNGFVLPAAIDKGIYVAIGKTENTVIQLYSLAFAEFFFIDIADLHITNIAWANYILGVVAQVTKMQKQISGFNMVIGGDLPIGAGLSSSAAVECTALFAINQLFQLQLTKLQIVQMAQQAEHEYAGVKCGIMDMFASVYGKKDYAIQLDCGTLNYQYVPLQLDGYLLVLLNTNIKHSLASSAYNTRRKECEQGVAWLSEQFPQVQSLRDATIAMLNEVVLSKNKLVYTRCRYVIEEITRLQEACAALANNDIKRLGECMYATHTGLSKAYEVSCAELDFLVDRAKNHEAVVGARMMGGGFGGCTINIIKAEAAAIVMEELAIAYAKEFNLTLTPYTVTTSNGTHQLV
jgi:galactokinase